MNEERMKILNMLSEGKISPEEANNLMAAVETTENELPSTNKSPKYMHIKVDSADGEKVNIKIPIKLIKAGMKLKELIPDEASDKINLKLKDKGIKFDIKDIKDTNIEELIEALSDFTVDVDSDKGEKVKIYCE